MKKIINISLLILTIFLVSTQSVKAAVEDIYYTNDNGISFTKQEYDYFSAMYYDGYQKNMTASDMAKFNGYELNPDLVESVEVDDSKDYFKNGGFSLMATSVETTAKILKISKGTGDFPIITINVIWKGSPKVRSYDLIGAMLAGTSSLGSPATTLRYTGGGITPSALKEVSNGFGASIKLPSSGTGIIVSQTFSVYKGGRVYASYQHAKKSLTLNNSQSFTINASGLGGVFFFNNSSIRDKYDAMEGVYVSV